MKASSRGLPSTGALNVVAADGGDNLYLEGASFAGSGGTGSGSLSLGSGVVAYLEQTSLANVQVSLADGDTFEVETSAAFTLAATASLSTTGTSNSQSFVPNTFIGSLDGAFVNQGTITDSNGATLSVQADKLSNTGTLSVSNGGTMIVTALESSSLTNAGLLSVGAGSLLEIVTTGAGVFTNTGSLAVNGGTLGLDFNLSTAKLASYPVTSGTLAIFGTLTNTATTLTVGTAGKIANLLLDGGTIIGGAIAGGADFTAVGGTLSAVKFQGTLALAGSGVVTTTGGLIMSGAGGTGAGTIIDHISSFDVLGNTTLGNAAMSIGASGSLESANINVGSFSETAGTTLTLSTSLTMTQSGGQAELFLETAKDIIVNDGKINAGISQSQFYAFGLNNAGAITVTNGDSFYLAGQSGSLHACERHQLRNDIDQQCRVLL